MDDVDSALNGRYGSRTIKKPLLEFELTHHIHDVNRSEKIRQNFLFGEQQTTMFHQQECDYISYKWPASKKNRFTEVKRECTGWGLWTSWFLA